MDMQGWDANTYWDWFDFTELCGLGGLGGCGVPNQRALGIRSAGDRSRPSRPAYDSPMRTIQSVLRLLLVLFFGLTPLFAQRDADRKEWLQLFNGKNLDGWTPKITGYPLGENYAGTFRVENGVLKVSYDRYTQFDGKFGHLF
jgi:hypothetical protein